MAHYTWRYNHGSWQSHCQQLNLTSAINIYPLKDSTIDDLYDTVLKDESTQETIVSDSVKLVE